MYNVLRNGYVRSSVNLGGEWIATHGLWQLLSHAAHWEGGGLRAKLRQMGCNETSCWASYSAYLMFVIWNHHSLFYRTRVRSLAMLVRDSLTDWLTDCRLVSLIDVTLACENAYSKLVEVVTVADISDEDRVGNILLQIWKLTFGIKAKLLFRLWAQGLVKILKLKFRQNLKLEFGRYFVADVL